MTHPRAADDFAMIRARLEELRRERARPRAADDFATIRARMGELRRERIEVLAEARGRSLIYPTPYHRAASERPGMNAGCISRAQWQDFPRSMEFSIPRPGRPEGFRVKN